MRDTLAGAAALAALAAAVTPAMAQKVNPALVTESEKSGFKRTGRLAEVEVLNDAFVRAYPDAVRAITFGTSPEGRPMRALVVSRSGALTPEAARERGLPVILVQGGIHAGEIDGKDAGYLALRQMLDGQAAPGALEKQVVVFVPVYNVDGHERFNRWNRPNQRGPEEGGIRATAQNINLNRDYIKADAPETRAMLRLIDAWDPIVYTDLHVTNGANFEHDVSVQIEPGVAGDTTLAGVGRSLRDSILARLSKQGSLPLPFYPSLARPDDPAAGFVNSVYTPRYSTGYSQLRNRFSILLETHSWKEYPVRVRITRNYIVDLVEETAANGQAWLREARAADDRAKAMAGQDVVLDWKATDKAEMIDFRGYAYTRTPSAITGGVLIRYDETKPQIWRVPFRDELVPSITARLPLGGYVVQPAYADAVAPLLELHGISFRRLDKPLAATDVETYRADKVALDAMPNEGRQRAKVEGEWKSERRDIPAGSLFVPSGQPGARLVGTLFEPAGPDSLLAWGQFNNALQGGGGLPAYVAEDVALAQLRDPAIMAEFTQRLTRDPAFARDQRARIEFFARRHSSWNPDTRLYPVFRVANPKLGE
ncbi:M14 family zinc carboxypeptidase [Sphingomonas sp.]|uniref:M14 family zinc carboxypeptidase n=1 Tax=Sphingomonas sp. TaxID=28214 RepID=UPI002C0DAFAC|nr:M14 family zinc carboxypeptidase [Sphingomonas sp.]HWK35059.1 M14 family zinc carboxypeptidase [Sphingomonas sp.]